MAEAKDKPSPTPALVQAAIAGDTDAQQELLLLVSDELDEICTRTTRLRNGRLVSHIDEDMRHQIKRLFLADLPNKTVADFFPEYESNDPK